MYYFSFCVRCCCHSNNNININIKKLEVRFVQFRKKANKIGQAYLKAVKICNEVCAPYPISGSDRIGRYQFFVTDKLHFMTALWSWFIEERWHAAEVRWSGSAVGCEICLWCLGDPTHGGDIIERTGCYCWSWEAIRRMRTQRIHEAEDFEGTGL